MFGYYEGFGNRQGVTDTRTVLSEAQRGGQFGSTTIRDPLTGQPFPNNTIPASRISPIATRILDQYIPLPNSSANRSVRSPDVDDSRQQFGTRVDLHLSDAHTVLGRYLVGHTNRRSARRLQLLAGGQHGDRNAAGRDGVRHVEHPPDDDQRGARRR